MTTDILTLPALNGGPRVEYRAIDGAPVPYMVTVQRRAIDGEWRTVTVGDVIDQLRLDGPVANWLREKTRVACDVLAMARYARASDPAYLRNVNY